MNLFKRIAWAVSPQKYRSAYSLADLDNQMDVAVWGAPTSSGALVTERGALALPPMWACVDLISKAVSVLPGKVFRGDRYGGDRTPLKNHYLYPLIHDIANPQLPANEWRRIVMGHLLGWGNHYSWIEWKANMIPKALYPLPPDRVKVTRKTVTAPIQYFVQDDAGTWTEFPASDILHIRGLGYDGTVGYSPVSMMREAFGISAATQNSAGSLHKNGMTSRIVIEYPGSMDEQQMKAFKESFGNAYLGLKNNHKAIVLQGGMKITPISINPNDAEFLEQWKYSDGKIYQIYGVPKHMVGDTSSSTSWGTGIEQQTIGFVTFTLLPWVDLIETWLALKLLPAATDVFVEYEFKGLLRGDSTARSAWYKTMIESGVYSPNRVLRAENEATYAGGDVYRRPLNTAFVNEKGEVVAFTPPGGGIQADAPTGDLIPNEQTQTPARSRFNGAPHLPI